jgi:hypothetical protein
LTAPGSGALIIRVTRRALPALAAVASLALLSATAVASSTVKVKSGTYKGTLTAPRTLYKVTLTVAHAKLEKATLSNIPFYCSSGGPATPVKFAAAKISHSGQFSTQGNYLIKLGPLKGKVGEKMQMSGRFKSNGTVAGTLRTAFVLNDPHCTGKTTFSASR